MSSSENDSSFDNNSDVSNMTPRGLLSSLKDNPELPKKEKFLEIVKDTFDNAFRSRNIECDSQSRVL